MTARTPTEQEDTHTGIVEKWDGSCRVENGVLYIDENLFLRLRSRYFFVLLLTIGFFSWSLYQYYTIGDTVGFRFFAVCGFFSASLVLDIMYGNYVWASLPFTNRTTSSEIPLESIREMSTKPGVNYNQERLIITYQEGDSERKRMIEFLSPSKRDDLKKVLC